MFLQIFSVDYDAINYVDAALDASQDGWEDLVECTWGRQQTILWHTFVLENPIMRDKSCKVSAVPSQRDLKVALTKIQLGEHCEPQNSVMSSSCEDKGYLSGMIALLTAWRSTQRQISPVFHLATTRFEIQDEESIFSMTSCSSRWCNSLDTSSRKDRGRCLSFWDTGLTMWSILGWWANLEICPNSPKACANLEASSTVWISVPLQVTLKLSWLYALQICALSGNIEWEAVDSFLLVFDR